MIQFETLLTGETSRSPRELTQLLATFRDLQGQIRQLTVTDLYILLRAETRGLNRPTVVRRLKRRLRATILDHLEEHLQFIAHDARPKGENEDE